MFLAIMTEDDIVSMQYHIKFTERIDFIFFESWNITSSLEYFKICLLLALLCIIIEAIGLDRWYVSTGRRMLKPKPKTIAHGSTDTGSSSFNPDFKLWLHCFDTVLQAVLKTSTYALMLAAMSYNMGLILVICFSLAIANFGFACLADWKYISTKLKAKGVLLNK